MHPPFLQNLRNRHPSLLRREPIFCANLKNKNEWQALLDNAVVRYSLEWLEKYAEGAALGDYRLDASGWFVNVHSYQTQPEEACVWESHEVTVDIQYMIQGNELIAWAPTSELDSQGIHCTNQDRVEWAPPSRKASRVELTRDRFVIFLPGEAHCPMIASPSVESIRKAVVKIPSRLLTSGTGE